ncbi:hypothetical protein BOTBODRAFT_35953 [Botryobasidium botryosum FD-172 SS1]|uniref:Ferrochelatase n=1 Tax=Botryobasidium botryosum (strain FD-172 SS1) TaxID=930990 RepID=A0A067M528_BOTB1|nr:hypothetical protein BOTBODRAFT_35953 [Botryobasidium botryosum FD-172 SS1]
MSIPLLARRNPVFAQKSLLGRSTMASLSSGFKRNKPPTAIVLMNMGGPSTLPEVHDFLSRLFHDKDLIPLPMQKTIAPWIARRRSPKIEQQYADIGGGSPILHWTNIQGSQMCAILDELSPSTAPHKNYTMFRYAKPLTESTLAEMRRDGVRRAVAFSQYPQYSCSTTGSSLNELQKRTKEAGMSRDTENGIEWSVIDRWGTHSGLVEAVCENIIQALSKYDPATRASTVLLFSAHSLPMEIVNRGDPYVSEVAGTVSRVIERLHERTGFESPYRLVWQSQVGPRPWMGQKTDDALKGLAKHGQKQVVLVPIAFTSDHIETLYELDLEYGKEAKELGIDLHRASSLNDSPIFIRALADLAADHLRAVESGERGHTSPQMMLRCPGCPSGRCGPQKAWFAKGGRD